MLNRLAKAAKTLPGAAALITAAALGGVGTAYALADNGDQGTVTIEQVASEPAATETAAPATTVAPAPVVEPQPVASETNAPAPEETTVAPKPASTEPNRVVTVGPDPDVKPLPTPAGPGNGSDDNGDGNGNFTVAPPASPTP